ncbi:MAG: transporter substrate-binding domain-containing protein, partial [Anaerolineae bacterium]
MLGLWALAACVAPATPALAPTPVLPPTPVGTADDWARIQAAGVINIAAPFDMYDSQFNPDGFDIALMSEVAGRLGLKAEFNNYAFEGLLNELDLNHADAVIAAMAITNDRQAQADFTTAYYVGEDSILAAPTSPIDAVTTAEELASDRLGVVSGTVYEAWLQTNLIQTGMMPAANLQTYTKADDAVARLAAGKVDLVILDREVALTYANEGRAKVVGKSEYEQNYGIAVRKGSSLLPQLNRALAEVQADGTVARLAAQYLNVTEDNVVATPTPPPPPVVPPRVQTPTPVGTPTPVPCKNSVQWVSDLSYPDGSTVQPGQQVRKGWQIRNSGTCNWAPDFTLAYAYGTYMGAQPVSMGVVVAPGATHEVWMDLTVPIAPGAYQSNYHMLDSQSVPFGAIGWVKIQVPAPATAVPPTAPPPPTSAPGVSFWTDTNTLQAGQSTWIHWRVSGVKDVYYHEDGQSEKGVTGNEDHQVSPTTTTSYYLRVVYPNNASETFEQRITVQSSPKNPPVITRFDSDPQGQVVQGNCLTLNWTVDGAVDRVALVRDTTPLWDYAPVSSSKTDCDLHDVRTYNYQLQAWGPGGGPVTSGLSINVIQKPPPSNPCE